MPEELFKIIIILGLSLIVSIILVLPVVVWRMIKRRPLVPEGSKIESPAIFYVGTVLLGGLAIIAFIYKMKYFGALFLIMLLIPISGIVAFKKGWRG